MKFGLGQPVRRHEDFRLIRSSRVWTDATRAVMCPSPILCGG
jgi:hypothetical protein